MIGGTGTSVNLTQQAAAKLFLEGQPDNGEGFIVLESAPTRRLVAKLSQRSSWRAGCCGT